MGNLIRWPGEFVISSGSQILRWPDSRESIRRFVRSGKSQSESSPNFSNFCPEFCPEFLSEFSPNFLRSFRASFRGKRRPDKNSPKIPAMFECKIPRQIRKKNSQMFLERRQSKDSRESPDSHESFQGSRTEPHVRTALRGTRRLRIAGLR